MNTNSLLGKPKEAIIECVPNFSEGRDESKIDFIRQAIGQVQGVKVLHVDSGYDANRTVITFAGSPEGVEEAAFRAIKAAAEVIDMRQQTGEHPRIGATDVMPLVPVDGISIERVVAISHRLSRRVATELNIPVYNYEKSASCPQRKRLESIRKGEYEQLEKKILLPEWKPDYGQAFNAESGATVIGARLFLLAYNVNLKTLDVQVAKDIAAMIRESGLRINGKRQKGYFSGVKAIGWDMSEYGMTQVSTNITDTELVTLAQLYEKVKDLAAERGIEVAGSELIGLAPLKCLLDAGHFYAPELEEEKEVITQAIESLGLNSVVPFELEERIIEYLL